MFGILMALTELFDPDLYDEDFDNDDDLEEE